MLSVDLVGHEYTQDRIERSVERILESTTLCSIASITPKGVPHISTAYFCWTSTLEMFFLSDPASTHIRNLTSNAAAAVTVYSTVQEWDADHFGLQLFGNCAMTRGVARRAAEAGYAERFPGYAHWWACLSASERGSFSSRYYVFRPDRVKVLDEQEFGEEMFIEARIRRRVQ